MLLLNKKEREEYEAYLQRDQAQLKDLAFLLSRLYVKEIDKTLPLGVPDSVLFFRTEPIMRVSCQVEEHIEPSVVIDRERERLQPLEENNRFFKACHDEEVRKNAALEESQTKTDDPAQKAGKHDFSDKYYPRIVRSYYLDGTTRGTVG